ncbi:hypothetical protein [Deinococcus ruber]|uniref:hypothetical protein n=1 Tax=Deinococcus ruber TaxID=1848197 RepID=UPI0035715C41
MIARQRPPTAKGFAFFVLEDRHARVQLIISPDLWEAHRQLLRDASALIAYGEARINGRAVTVNALRLAGLPLPLVTSAPAPTGTTSRLKKTGHGGSTVPFGRDRHPPVNRWFACVDQGGICP